MKALSALIRLALGLFASVSHTLPASELVHCQGNLGLLKGHTAIRFELGQRNWEISPGDKEPHIRLFGAPRISVVSTKIQSGGSPVVIDTALRSGSGNSAILAARLQAPLTLELRQSFLMPEALPFHTLELNLNVPVALTFGSLRSFWRGGNVGLESTSSWENTAPEEFSRAIVASLHPTAGQVAGVAKRSGQWRLSAYGNRDRFTVQFLDPLRFFAHLRDN